MASSEKSKDTSEWLTPKQAVRTLEPTLGTNSDSYIAKHTLLERLRGGKLLAVAEDSSVSDDGGREHAGISEIPKDHWTHIDEHSLLWTSGDVTYSIMEGDRLYRRTITFRLYRVKFEPNGVSSILPPESAVSPLPSIKPADDKRPPVAAAHLVAWYDAYKKIYGGTAVDTEPHAIDSARRMFPEKRVSRDAVRKLRGVQKPGPKSPQNSVK